MKFWKMSFIAILDQIKCCKEKDYDHIVKEPIELNCGHSICKKCFLIENNKTVFNQYIWNYQWKFEIYWSKK